jgi:protein phosphatase
MKIESFALSDIGRVRQENQDSNALFANHGLFVVADGMGGHKGGRQASETAVAAVAERFLDATTPASFEPSLAMLVESVAEANRRIRDYATTDSALARMGTTLVALLLDPNGSGAIVHVGDSRVYRLRAGALEQLTSDHTIVNDLLRNHDISEAEASVHPYRHMLTRALGPAADVAPEVRRIDALVDDLYVLCSDGVSGMLSPDAIQAILVTHQQDPEQVCRQLVEAANQAGGKDNATAIAVRCAPD